MRIQLQRLIGDGQQEAPPYSVDVPDNLPDPLVRIGNLLASHFWDEDSAEYCDPGFKLIVEVIPDGNGPATFTLTRGSCG
jgi:hypothetical protein